MASEFSAVVLDAGALISAERRSRRLGTLVAGVEDAGGLLILPAPALAQVWRGGPRQVLLSRFLSLPFVEVDLLTVEIWQAAGSLCGQAGTSDVVDAAVVACARSRAARVVITTDPDALRHLDPGLDYWTA